MTSAQFLQLHHSDLGAIRAELTEGLLAPTPSIAPKYFYDTLGARLFESITELPEYYPTRSEAALFERHAPEIARRVPPQGVMIDLGAGNCAKAAGLFSALRPAQYVAVDISVDFLRDCLTRLSAQWPGVTMRGLGIDFSQGLSWPDALALAADRPRLMFYPGSSIGNFTPGEALVFLRSLHVVASQVPGGGLLIGVDLIKDTATLEAAYDDALGVTAAFNRNVLRHVNRVLGSNFLVEDWRHIAHFDIEASRIEMHLECVRDTRVHWPGGDRHFAAGTRIHTENSYKWTVESFTALLRDAGFGTDGAQTVQAWVNPEHPFALVWAAA